MVSEAARILRDRATTTVYSTDNSIYQVRPSGVALPRQGDEIAQLLRENAAKERPQPIVARGGGTGTNGQSLTDGVVVDVKRHLNRIVSLDVEGQTVVVQPGVVTAELNASLAEHGLFWPPHTSTLNRATVGGMISTDAAGKGSIVHGRTHRHVVSIEMLLPDGTPFTAVPTPRSVAEERAAGAARDADPRGEGGAAAVLWASLLDLADQVGSGADLGLPELARGFSGYGLDRLVQLDDCGEEVIDPIALVCGAEGTLGVITEATLRLTPLPNQTLLVVASYDSFADALDDAVELAPLVRPSAIESFDETTLERGRSSPAWPALGAVVGEHRGSVLLLEFDGDELPEEAPVLDALRSTGRHLAVRTILDPAEQRLAWKVRADAVGLLAKVATGGPNKSARPTAFVEDCAVPVASMPAFIAGFRRILDDAGVAYGMFGHADVGCVHVRPALDLTDPEDVALVRSITDDVVELVAEHGGVLWGEHGRGFRGDSAEAFLSASTIALMRRVKSAFDPLDICNPGKLYRPVDSPSSLIAVDEPTLRGTINATVPLATRTDFESAFACNGNGLCHHYAGAEVMCPSFKATGDPALSPKGRSDLVRAWLAEPDDDELADAVAANLDQCLSCSACAGHCPVEVDIPEIKSRFFERYYAGTGSRTRRRPLAHTLLARFEEMAVVAAKAPPLARLGSGLASRALGLVDLPAPAKPIAHGAPTFVPDASGTTGLDIVIVPDVFTSALDPATLADAVTVLQALGRGVHVAPFVASGKFDHVKGRRVAFARAVARQRTLVDSVLAAGATPVVIEPAVALLHQHEYPAIDAAHPGDEVAHLVDVLHAERTRLVELSGPHRGDGADGANRSVVLLGHCTERATRPVSLERWAGVLEAVGGTVETPAIGCCGMAGIFGHERANQRMSRDLWDATWAPQLQRRDATFVATGYSCRSQSARFTPGPDNSSADAVVHPVSFLARRLER